jgi:hypothetical protein
MELRKDVQDAILRTVQQSGSASDFSQLEKIYGKDVIAFHLADLIEVHLIEGEIIKGISPPNTNFLVRGLTAAGRRHFGVAPSSGDIAD